MLKYYFSKQGQQLGPWTRDEVLFNLKSNKVEWVDYVYDEDRAEWILLAEHKDFFNFFKSSAQAPAPVKAKAVSADPKKDQAWFVLKGENKYGPFSYLELVRLLQEKNLFEFDYVWNASLAKWSRLSECEEFQPEKVRSLLQNVAHEKEEIFFRRRHARAKYGASVVVHNNKQVWKGNSLEISAGGAALLIETTSVEPGHTLFLHFKVGDEVPPFNAVCSIISKQIVPNSSFVKYGVKFVSISRDVQHAIKAYAEKSA